MKTSNNIVDSITKSNLFWIKIENEYENVFNFGERLKIFSQANDYSNKMFNTSKNLKEFVVETFKISESYYEQLFDAYSKMYN